MKRLLTLLIAMCIVATPILMAQSVGDYGSAKNGNWYSDSTWVVCVTDGTWDGATPAGAAPEQANNIWIRAGHTVTFTMSSKKCNNLTIEAGGSLVSNSAVTSPSYVGVCGTTLTVNGNYGGESDGLGLKPFGAVGNTLTITGTGTCNISRIQPQNNDQTLVFDIDCGINYSGSEVGKGSSALYPNGKDNCVFTINAGKTVTLADGAYISLGSSGSSAGTLNMTLNVNGTLVASGTKSIINLNTATGKASNLNIGSGGALITNSYLRGGANNAGTVGINIAAGATLSNTATGTFDFSTADVTVAGNLVCAGTMDIGMKQIMGTGAFSLEAGATLQTAHPDGLDGSVIVSGVKTFDAAANYVFNGTTVQATGLSMPATVGALTINNAAGVTLSQNTDITGELVLTSGDLALNGKTLTYMLVSGTGTISETMALSAPSAVNPGSLGATITSAADLGSTVVKRGFTAQAINASKNSIAHWYMITPTTNTGLNATLQFAYDEAEIVGMPEGLLALYSSTDTGKTWVCRNGTVDATNNHITLAGIDGFSMWTISTVVGMEGVYYVGNAGTKPGGGDPDFLSLNHACDSLSNGAVTGDVTMYITSDLTEPTNVDLAVTTDYTITFKPYTGITPTVTYTQIADNAGASGAWVIGMKNTSGAPFVPTHNIVIDGSNVEAGSTRDLTFVSAHGKNAYPFRIKGDCDNITIKNCIMSADTSAIAYGIWVNSQDNNIPDNLTIDNCSITANASATATPIHVSYSGTITAGMENLVITNNDIIARTRGVFLNGNTNIATIEGNTFEVNQTASGYLSSAVMGNKILSTGMTNIIGNDFKVNATANVAASNGIRTITASGGGTFIIANNFFRGFAAPTASGAASEIVGIRCGSTVEAYYNTFILNNIDATTGSVYRAINIAAGTPTIKNNIFVVEENDFTAYCIGGMPGASDYNNFYLPAANANVGFKTVAVPTLAVWQDSTDGDAHSVTKAVEFASATDLHLAGASLGDFDLAGTPIATILNDIDGDVRDATYPYMGADEGTPALTPPVEITTIAEIQDTTGTGSGNSKYKDQVVTTTGIITAGKTSQYFIQDKTGPWNGIFVYDYGRIPVVGDSILIEALVTEYYGLTELKTVTKFEVLASGKTLPEPVLLSTADYKQEQWEGVLVTVDNAECISTGNEWEVNDGSGVGRIDDLLFAFTPKIGYAYKVTGPVNYSYDNFMVTPRSADDIVEYAPEIVLPLYEGATDGTLDLEWTFDPWGMISANHASLTVVDSTTSAWGSHVIAFFDSSYTGIAEVANAVFTDYTISSDIYIVGPADANFNLYTGLAIMADSNKYYRLVYRNSSASDNGQIKLQGYDGAAWHISKNWNPGTDFTALETGWHNFKVTKMGNNFWAYIDGVELPGCPLQDEDPFMTEGAPGIYKYNTGIGTVLFDNFAVVEPEAAFVSIAEAIRDNNGDLKSDLIGKYVTVQGIITTPNLSYNANAVAGNYERCDYFIQDETGGINLYSFNFRSEYQLGDLLTVTGKIDTYNGKNEIIPDSAKNVVVVSSGNPLPEPKEISLADLNSEKYEGQLVLVRNLHPVKLSAWPVMDTTYSNNYSCYSTDGSSDTVQVFIDRQTEVITWDGLPYYYFDVVGVATQYSKATPPNTGYEIIPRFETDFTCFVPTEGLETEMVESFETAVPPTGWYSFVSDLDSGIVTEPWTKSNKAPVDGSYHAYMNNYNSGSYCWLVTPALSTKSEKNILRFVAFDEANTTQYDFGSELVVLASTESGLFLNQWTEVKRITEAECVGAHPIWEVELPALSDTNYIYIAFMVHNFGDPDNPNVGGDNWIIDHVQMVVKEGIANEALPMVFALHQNYPNPFNPTTMIKYDLPKESNVKLVIYDLMGREVRTLVSAKQSAGYKAIQWDSKNNAGRFVSSGYYICVMNAGEFHKNIKMILIK